jgi:predicted nucleotidyltransferase
METKLKILKSFFDNPNKKFHIRELSRLLNINHTTIRKYLSKFEREGFLSLDKNVLTSSYKLTISRKTLNLKLYYNLENIRKSGIIEDLEKHYDYPVIVLFGSYAKARDDLTSDIDVCIISNINKEFNVKKYEKIMGKEISLHIFDKNSLEKSKKSNSELINNISNGIVLSGELEVL